jgi:hypothetical protein
MLFPESLPTGLKTLWGAGTWLAGVYIYWHLSEKKMAAPSTARVLQDRLTERGLARSLAKQDVSPQLVHVLSIEQAARASAKRSMGHSKPPRASVKKTAHKAPTGRVFVRRVQPNYWRRVKKELHILGMH